MKKLILSSVFFCLAALCMGQSPLTHYNSTNSYSRYKVDATIGGAFPIGAQQNGMLVVTVEPHYRLSDANAIGLRIQDAFLRQINNSVLDGFTVSPIDSYCITGEHYFSNNFFRPFFNFGAGLFRQGEVVNTNSPANTIKQQTHIGIVPSIGFEIGLFRFNTEYDIMNNNSNGTNPSYFSVGMGFFLGGGGKDRINLPD